MQDRTYVTPEMEIIAFDTEDVITTSSGMKLNPGEAGSNEGQGDFGDLFGG